MKSRTGKHILGVALLVVLLTVLAVPAFAASYSKVYGQTQDKIRVRESGSTSATVIDLIASKACVYIVDSRTSGHNTFVQVRYRGYEGDVLTGWICQTDGDDTYVKILSATQANKLFGVKDGNLPTKRVGLYNQKKRNEAKQSGSSGSSSADSSVSASTIKDVQTKLKALGIYSGEITGHAGDKTKAAIKAFQKRYGLTADGVAGSKTVEKLNSVYKSKGASSSSSSSSSSTGSKSAIAEAQEKLKALGIYAGEITGNAGEKTVAAIKAFQKKYGLTADGVLGSETMSKLRSVGGSSSASYSSGSVADVQNKLKALGFYSGEITGNAGTKTVAAIKAFQAKYGLTADGVAGSKTTAKLNEVYKNKGGSSSSSANYTPSTSSSTLKLGSTGSGVSALQENLTALGFYYGDITGHFGSMTEAAVKKFQKSRGLSQTGVANKTTQNAIVSAMGGGSNSKSSGTTSITTYGRTTTSGVTVRADHSTSSAGKVSLENATPLKITKRYTASNGDVWYYVSAQKNGYTYRGYVSGRYVTIISYSDYAASSGKNANDDEVIGLLRVTASGVAIREDKGTDSGKVGTANRGDMFYYTDRSGDWYKLKSGYYIMAKYCERVSDSDATSYANDGSSSGTTYRVGDTGSTVSWIQQRLKDLGMYSGEVTGHYGTKTAAAVEAFQEKRGLTADGIVGSKTMAALQGYDTSSGSSSVNVKGTVYNLDWFKAKNAGRLADYGLAAKKTAKLKDLKTGKTLNIYIQSAGNHLDVEPAAANDTQTLCSIYGVSSASYINYVRRPMLIETSNGYQIVCSIYGTPHGQQNITNNNFPGQFCLHFLGSKTHNSDKVDSDHQACINQAISLVGGSVSLLP